jgi:hypothetical protein
LAYTERKRKGFSTFRNFGKGRPNTDTAKALRSFEHSTSKSDSKAYMKFAEVTPGIVVYLQAWRGSPDLQKIIQSKDDKEKAANLAGLAAQKGSAHLLVKDDLAKKTNRFKVLKKSEAKKEVQKELKAIEELSKNEETNPILDARKLPTQKEILERAQQMYMHDNGRQDFQEGVGTNLPERNELQEEGYLQRAKLDLMTSEDGRASRSVMDYVDNLRQELEKIGFTVEPVAGFDVTNLQY